MSLAIANADSTDRKASIMTSDSRFEPKITPAERLMLTVEQSAELLGLGRTTTYELVMSGTIESVHVGRRRLIPRSRGDDSANRHKAFHDRKVGNVDHDIRSI